MNQLTSFTFITLLLASVMALQAGDPVLPASKTTAVTISNELIQATFDPAQSAFAIRDLHTGQTWRQQALNAVFPVTRAAAVQDAAIVADLFDASNNLALKMTARLEPHAAELVVELTASGAMSTRLSFPSAFAPERGTRLIVPVNEGIAFPVDDPTLGNIGYTFYSGMGVCMAFFGATDGNAGVMTLLETEADAELQLKHDAQKLLAAQPVWISEKGQFGYARKLRYIFFQQGGHVAMCKRYRAYAAAQGRLKTFTQKHAETPNVDLLAGAVNVWCRESDSLPIIKEMQASGIRRILWSSSGSSEQVTAMNQMPGVLTSRYDIYQDAMSPEKFPLLSKIQGDWTSSAWPTGMVKRADGTLENGWQVVAKDGSRISCNVLSDKLAPDYARQRIAKELQTKPYRCRFLDTVTASKWREDYDANHPMTRRECRTYRNELLAVVSREFKLVCGTEDGHDTAVPFADYLEGMMSLVPGRVHDSGRNTMQKIDIVPPNVAKFQVGAEYRLPLWELVYHDCIVSTWYWGDYNNKLPAIWDKRDLFNALYGTPPMFMFNRQEWNRDRDRFVQSYRATSPVAHATFYSEMTDHRYLSADRMVQQTHFADGTTVTVNFSAQAFKLTDGRTVGPLSADVTPRPND